jgi:integrase
MPSFRSDREQARSAVSAKIALGQPRHGNKEDGQIHSVRSAQAYTQSLSGFTSFIRKNSLGDLKSATPETAEAYLEERQEAGLSQKTLDQVRQALQCHLAQPLVRLHALEKTILKCRSYTKAQIQLIASQQSEKNALATEITHAAGLRASELQTLRPAAERPASSHRTWSADRFTGRNGVLYTVQGKGGLIRQVMIPHELALRLEMTRMNMPKNKTDRGVHFLQRYNIGGGKNWSTSFARVSLSQLGWSNGGHGLRHTFAQQRMSELQGTGFTYRDALGITAQELGHFSPTTTEAYLR